MQNPDGRTGKKALIAEQIRAGRLDKWGKSRILARDRSRSIADGSNDFLHSPPPNPRARLACHGSLCAETKAQTDYYR